MATRRGSPSRNLANETTDDAVQALIDATTSRYDVPQRYYRLKAKLLGLDQLEHYDRFAPVADDASKTSWDEARGDRRRRVRELLGRGRRSGRAVLRRRLDRRAGAARQAPRRVLRDERPGRASVRVHELHGRPPLDPHARPRARPRPARLAGAAARPVQRVDAADDGRDRVGVRRGAHVQAAARRGGRPAAGGSTCSPGQLEDAIATTFRQIAMNRFENLVHTERREQGELSTDRLDELWLECQSELFGDSVGIERLRRPGGATSRTSRTCPATSTRTPTATCSRWRSSARTSERATRSSRRISTCCGPGGSKAPEELAQMVGLDLTDPSIWASGIEALADDLDEAEALATEIGLG